MNEDRATRYQRFRRQASMASVALTVTLLLAVSVTGLSGSLRDALAGAGEVPGVIAATLFVAVLAVLHHLLQLPLAFYSGVVLERRYGLSTESLAHWWRDHAKASVLSVGGIVAGGALVWGALRLAPSSWWIWAASGSVFVAIALTFVAPVILLPIFDECTSLDRRQLTARLLALARRADTEVLGVFQWHLSARTKKANAALTGFGKTRRILVSDTLLADHSDDEIEVILAHELAHHIHHDLWMDIAMHGVLVAAALYIADLGLTWFVGVAGLGGKADLAGLPVLALCAGVAMLALSPISNAVSRAHERRADRYALEMTRNVPAFISAMRRLGAMNLSDDRPSPLVERLFYTHPPVSARIAAAQRWAPSNLNTSREHSNPEIRTS